MKLILTGATGFVGRNFLLRVLKENRYEKIYVAVRSREKMRAQFAGDGFEDIPSSVVTIATSGPEWKAEWPEADHLVHCASSMWGKTRADFFDMNVKGTLSLLQNVRVSKALILSSQAAAGPCDTEAAKVETDAETPITWYGESKLEMERRVPGEFPKLNFLFLRPPMVLGPRDTATLALFQLMRSPVRFKPGFKLKHYSYIGIHDLVAAMLSSLDSDWSLLSRRVFFVGSDAPISDRELLTTSAQVAKRKGVLIPLPQSMVRIVSQVVESVPALRARIPTLSEQRARELWPDSWVVSSNAFKRVFNWTPVANLQATLQETRDWYVKTGQLPA